MGDVDRVQVGGREARKSFGFHFFSICFSPSLLDCSFTSCMRAPMGKHHGPTPALLPETDDSWCQTFTVHH